MDLATLAIEVRSNVKEATQDLRLFQKEGQQTERAAQGLAAKTEAAGRSSEEFSRRVRRSIETLQFQAAQLTRSAEEQERYNMLRRAGVTAESAAGQVITKSIQLLQQQRQEQQKLAEATRQSTALAQQQAAGYAALAAAEQQRSAATRKVIADLEFERAQLSRTSTERMQYDALRRAGVTAASAEGKAIMTTVAALETERAALRQVTAARQAAAAAAPGAALGGYMSRPGQVGLNAQQRVMLGYQLQDIFTSLASGMNPAVVAAQQGPQISMLYGGMGNMFRAIPRPLLVGGGLGLAGALGLAGLNSLASATDDRRIQDRRFGNILGGDGTGMFRDLGRVASETSIGIDQTTESVERLAKATRSLGASRQDVLGLAGSVEKLIKLGGANDNEASAAREGFAGMMNSATVSAEQLKAVLTNVPGIAAEIAAGIGVSVTQLRLMVDAGEVTNREVLDGMLQRSAAVNAEFQAMPKSVGDLFSSIGTDLGVALKNLADSIPLVNQYRNALELAARAAKGLRDVGTPESNASIIARTTGLVPGGNASEISAQTMAGRFTPDPLGTQRGGAVGNSNVLVERALEERAQALRNLHAQMRLEEQATADAARRAADETVVSASAVAKKFDELGGTYRQNQREIEAVEKALDVLQAGLTSLSAEEAANQIGILTGALVRARETARDIDPALKAINDLNRRNEFRANDPSDAGMAYQARVRELSGGDPAREQNAITAALAEQHEKINDIVAAKQREAEASALTLEAMKKGKAATIEAQVQAAVLAFTWGVVGQTIKDTPEGIRAIADYTKAVREALTNQNAIGGVNASKPLLDDLAAVAAAMKVVEQGAYAMKRAEAEARAGRDETGTGGLQMQVFDARQSLADATSIDALKQEVELTTKLAAAAGDVAKQKQIQLEFDIKRAQLAAGPGARADIEREMRAKAAADTRRETAEGAAELERQVELVKQQTEIVRAGNADYAAQLAMLQKKNELLARGVDIASEEAQRQIAGAGNLARANVELDRAKEAADATKRIWMNAWDGVQSYGADVFFDVFRNVPVDGKNAADTLKNIFFRAFSEIAAAAVIRPIVAPIFSAAGSIFGGGSAMPAAIGSSGAGGGLSMPSMGLGNIYGGGGGSWLGGVGDWLNTPLTGPYAGMSPSSMAGVPMLSPSMWNPSTWGITPMQGLGAAAGIGMGAYQLIRGGGSTASTIGGIGSMIGGAVSLIPGVGQVAGPLIALASNILPGLFESRPEPPTMRATGGLNFRGGRFVTSGSEYGGASSVLGTLGGAGTGMQALLQAAGVTSTESPHSINYQTFSKGDFANATTFVNGRQWGQGSGDDAGLDTAAAHIAHKMMMEVGSGISDNMRAALSKFGLDNLQHAFSMEELGTVVADISRLDEAMKQFGVTTPDVTEQMMAVKDSFNELFDSAKKYGLAATEVAKIEAERNRQMLLATKDFTDRIELGLLEMKDPVAAAMHTISLAREADLVANDEYLRLVVGYQDRRLQLEELYRQQELDVIDQANKEALAAQQQYANDMVTSISSIQDLIRDLTPGGALANVDPTTKLAGLQASYAASYAQASASPTNSTLVEKAASDARAFLEFSQSYHGGNSSFVRDQQSALQQLQSLQAAAVQGMQQTAIGFDPQLAQLLQQILTAVQKPTAAPANDTAQRDANMTRLIDLMLRFFADRRAA